MPTYSYRCPRKHTHLLPARLDMQPAEVVTCPECQEDAKRVYLPPQVIFNGKGWTGAQKEKRR